MTILTESGVYLSGAPADIVARLGDLAAAGVVARHIDDIDAKAVAAECARIARYRVRIGPEFAGVVARGLIRALEEEGYLLVQHD